MSREVPSLLALVLAATYAGAAEVPAPTIAAATPAPPPVTVLADDSPAAQAGVAACTQVSQALSDRGWKLAPTVVRIENNPFDATRRPVALALAAAAAPEDNAFDLAEALVRRALQPAPRRVPVDALARTVAAHLSDPTCGRRQAWEHGWLRGAARGDLLSTVLPELLWRTGGDEAIRAAAAGPWPAAALDALRGAGCDDPAAAAGELVLAALLSPSLLSFSTGDREVAPAVPRTGSPEVWLDGPGAALVALPAATGAVAVQPLRIDDAAAWLAVRYSVTGAFDAVRLADGHELSVPLDGVDWAAVVVVGVAPRGHVSLGLRALPGFPQVVTRWDFLAANGAASLAWETGSHQGLAAYVVEALSQSEQGSWSVDRREIIPVADQGDAPYGYSFVDPDSSHVAAYRLLALTVDGLLGEIGSFPLPGE